MAFRNANLASSPRLPEEKTATAIQYTNVAFSGAGVNGAAHVGAIQAIQADLGGSLQPLTRIAGTSAGSIAAMLVTLNCTAAQAENLFMQIDLKKIADGHNIINEMINIERQESKFDGVELRKMITTLLVEAGGNVDITYGELKANGYKDLHVMTTCVGKRFGEGTTEPKIFSAENTPGTKILPTILASASIPGAFPPVLMKEVAPGTWEEVSNPDPDDLDVLMFADGGAKHNLPVRMFDKKKFLNTFQPGDPHGEEHCFNPETIGVMICSPAETQGNTKLTGLSRHQPLTYAFAIINGAIFGTQDTSFWHSMDRLRTALVSNNNISSTNFDITRAQQDLDIQSGLQTLTAFLVAWKKAFCAPGNVVQMSAFGKQNWSVPSSPVFGGGNHKPLKQPLLTKAEHSDTDADNEQSPNSCPCM